VLRLKKIAADTCDGSGRNPAFFRSQKQRHPTAPDRPETKGDVFWGQEEFVNLINQMTGMQNASQPRKKPQK
jgi:hypothetical protein